MNVQTIAQMTYPYPLLAEVCPHCRLQGSMQLVLTPYAEGLAAKERECRWCRCRWSFIGELCHQDPGCAPRPFGQQALFPEVSHAREH